MNAELFARGKDNVSLLLSLLEEEGGPTASDFYVRYHALQLLTCCAMAGSYRLQEVLLLPLSFGVKVTCTIIRCGSTLVRKSLARLPAT